MAPDISKDRPVEDRLILSNWTILAPSRSISLRQPADLGDRNRALAVTDVTISPDDSYCFTVKRADGLPVVTFCFQSFGYALTAARQMAALLPRIVHYMTWRR